MNKQAYAHTPFESGAICPTSEYEKLVALRYYQDGEPIITPDWFNTPNMTFGEAIGYNLVVITMVCYRLGVTDFSQLYVTSSEQNYPELFEQEMERLSYGGWEEFYNNAEHESTHLYRKEVDGIEYVLERVAGVANVYMKM